jgi:hypothetical protein
VNNGDENESQVIEVNDNVGIPWLKVNYRNRYLSDGTFI